jgi:hypothetical protein
LNPNPNPNPASRPRMQRRVQREDQLKEVITSSKGICPPPGAGRELKEGPIEQHKQQLCYITDNHAVLCKKREEKDTGCIQEEAGAKCGAQDRLTAPSTC